MAAKEMITKMHVWTDKDEFYEKYKCERSD